MPKVKLNDMVFDARPDRVDLRDREYRPPLKSLPHRYPDLEDIARYLTMYKRDNMILDQGEEGACTGFGLAAVINFLLWREARVARQGGNPPAKVSERMLYQLAKFYDEWPGEDYDGSSCRGAIKGWHRHGVCTADLWPYRDDGKEVKFVRPKPGWDADAAQRPLGAYYRIDKNSIVDMQAAIVEVGAVYVSASVHDGWFPPRLVVGPDGTIPVIATPVDPSKTGGHAFAIVGYNEVGFVVQNSWGVDWGKDGFAILPYADWVERGMDAWVAVMGAPMVGTSPHYQMPLSLSEVASARREFLGLIPKGETRSPYEKRNVPTWSTDDAYRHSIVTGNNGIVLNRDVTSNSALDYLDRVVHEKPLAWAKESGKDDIVFYAHGGLNDEEASIKRIRILGPYFQVNGAYPIFFTWKTGFLESIGSIVGDEIRGIEPQGAWRDVLEGVKDALKEAKDRAIEAACQNVLVRTVWTQMKQNAYAAAYEPRATLELTVDHIRRLRAARPNLRIHLVGHSAGSILFGHFLDLLLKSKIPVASCTLFAPACTVPFALKHYKPATDPQTGILKKENTAFEILSDERELADSVGPYGKSLLYLVSRALEEHHKMPLLGMANFWAGALDRDLFGSDTLLSDVKKWQDHWAGARWPNELTEQSVFDGQERIPAAHGSFDNDVKVITRTIGRILGGPLGVPVESLHGF